MMRLLLVLLLVLTPVAAFAADRTPLLMDGKKTLYQRVLTRPQAVLKRQPGDGPGAAQPAMTRFYVYDRKAINGQDWLEVGLTTKGKTDGWIAAETTLPWKQQMALAFTNPAGRDRSLLFADRNGLATVAEAEKPETLLAPLRQKVLSGKGDPKVVSIEPDPFVDINKQFYLLPILAAEETFSADGHRVRLLNVASVSAKDDPLTAKTAPADSSVTQLRNFNAAIVFVIDTTISMAPYIDRTRDVIKEVQSQVEKAGLADRVRFGLVAFRANPKAAPGLDYAAKLYVNPADTETAAEFQAKAKAVEQATVSSARFDEDPYAGVMLALNDIPWNEFGGRYIILVTDAGAVKGGDPLSMTGLDAEQVRLEALHRGVALYTLHLKTPAGTTNHAGAEAQYKSLSFHPLINKPLYYPVPSGDVGKFGKTVDSLAAAIVRQVDDAYHGKAVVGSAASAQPAPAKDDPLQQDTALLGHAMQLAWLGRVQGTRAPPLFSAWISDRDPAHPDIATTEVRVLLTKNQLSDMQQVLQAILKAGESAQLAPDDFLGQMRSAAAIMGRDPNAITGKNATKLADLGLMGEYLDDLPYRSKILDVDQALWSSWSISQQQAFLDEIRRKLRLYQIYHDDVDRWVALDNGADPGEAVYPVPLDALP